MAAILVVRPEPFEQVFVPPSQGDSRWNLASIGLVVIEEKKKFKIFNLRDLDQGQWVTLTFASTNFCIVDYNSFWKKKSIVLPSSYTKA